MKIYLGADHRGFKLKEYLKIWLKNKGYDVIDVGAETYDPDDDYVAFAVAVSRAVSKFGNQQFGILICGSGVGMDIAANKVRGIRCGLGLSPAQVAAARNDDDINVLSIAADYTNIDSAKDMARVFLETPFSNGERHLRRLEKIDSIEHESIKSKCSNVLMF